MVASSKKKVILLLGLAVLLISPSAQAQIWADLVIYNGKILTTDSPDPDNFRIAEAAAIYEGKFIVVGSDAEVLQYAGANTKKIDLGGRTVIPGLVETHHHIYGYGSHFFPDGRPPGDPPLRWTTKEEFLSQIRTLALKKKPGEWINAAPGMFGVPLELHRGDVTRFDLDNVAPNNPVFIHWESENEAIVNTKLLDMLLAWHPNVKGVKRDDKGAPTGRLSREATRTIVFEFEPKPSAETLGPYYKMEMEESAAQGMTTISTKLYPDHLAAYSWLHARGELPTRMAYSLGGFASDPNPEAAFSRLSGLQGGSGKNIWGAGDDKLWMIGVYLGNIDLTPGDGGSCVSKPYPREAPNFPLWRFQYYGPYGLCPLTDPNFNHR